MKGFLVATLLSRCGDRSRRLGRVKVALIAAFVLVALPASAAAALTWTAPTKVDGTASINAVTCVSTTECVAVDGSGSEVTFNPTSLGSPSAVPVATGGAGFEAVACVSGMECVAVDNTGRETEFNPTNPTSTTPVLIDGTGTTVLHAVACPSPGTECTAVDGNGAEVTFDPMSPGSPVPVPIDGTNSLSAVACPSSTQCTAVEANGDEVTFDPAGVSAHTAYSIDTDAWTCTQVGRLPDEHRVRRG
jgi:hypothetical protein